MKYRRILMVFVAALILSPMISFAQTDPKGAFYAPAGTNGLLYYFKHITGHEQYVHGNKVAKNVDMLADISMLRYAYYGKVGIFPYALNAIAPYGSQHMEIGTFNQTSTGFGDVVGVASLWFIDLPKYNFYVEGTLYLTAPTGDYHNDQLVNMSGNRWTYKPELGIAWKPTKNFSVEILGNVEIFGDNNDYSTAGLTLQRDPLYGVWGHLTYDINKTLFVALSSYYWWGGETQIADVDQNNKVETLQGMFTTGIHINPNLQLLLQYKKDFSVENGVATDVIQSRIAYFF